MTSFLAKFIIAVVRQNSLRSPTYNRNHKMNRLISLLKVKTEKRKNSRVRRLNQPKFSSELVQVYPACRYS